VAQFEIHSVPTMAEEVTRSFNRHRFADFEKQNKALGSEAVDISKKVRTCIVFVQMMGSTEVHRSNKGKKMK
jgi:hypothetical protein